MKTQIELIHTALNRQTFSVPKIKQWVEQHCTGKTLNLFAGTTLLNINEVRNDRNTEIIADYNLDALDFILSWKGHAFDTILLDPPYSYRKAMEMYEGHYSSRFKRIADNIPKLLTPNGKVISFGYHSTFMGKKRGFFLERLCVFAHGGAQHCTIAIVEKRK